MTPRSPKDAKPKARPAKRRTAPRTQPHRPPPVREPETELAVHGRYACAALFQHRPGDMKRVYLVGEVVKHFGALLKHCAEQRRPYHIVPAEEVESVSKSSHHEGICVVAALPPPVSAKELLRPDGPLRLLGLAGVRNPHNLGAILRVAAHFGVGGVLTDDPVQRLPGAAYRTAQGGAEWVPVASNVKLARFLAECHSAGVSVCATSGSQGEDLFTTSLPPRALILLGAEDEGLSRELIHGADRVLRIPGTGRVESLNVATAAAAILAEFWRRHGPATPHEPKTNELPKGQTDE